MGGASGYHVDCAAMFRVRQSLVIIVASGLKCRNPYT